jgi:hypothetical protein
VSRFEILVPEDDLLTNIDNHRVVTEDFTQSVSICAFVSNIE